MKIQDYCEEIKRISDLYKESKIPEEKSACKKYMESSISKSLFTKQVKENMLEKFLTLIGERK